MNFGLCKLYNPTCDSVLFRFPPFPGAPFENLFSHFRFHFPMKPRVYRYHCLGLLDTLLIILDRWCFIQPEVQRISNLALARGLPLRLRVD